MAARQNLIAGVAAAAALALFAGPAAAADAPLLDARDLGIVWALPFVGVLLSIAVLPLWTPGLWHHHFGKIAAAWALAFILPAAFRFGAGPTAAALAHVALEEYLPFLILIFALFTVAGHIVITGNLHGSPALNTGFLAAGTALASLTGTTGAAMALVRPLLRANDDRAHNAHVFVFFIFLVANIGGSLTPLGDPPLFLGFLQGVRFFWTVQHLIAPTLVAATILLALFFAIDLWFYRREGRTRPDPTPDSRIGLDGWGNVALLFAIMAAVLFSGAVRLGTVHVFGVELAIQNLLRDGALIAIALASYLLSPARLGQANEFDFGPAKEVAKLFAAIFVTIVPVIAILRVGRDGALGGVIAAVTNPDGRPNDAMYFWLTGALSSFLDNAPTYLLFFNAAGGDAETLMGPLARTLAAISAGAVFMGANSYIGNAPNMLVKSIADARGVRMPSFFGYMLWSGAILLPLFALITQMFFRA